MITIEKDEKGCIENEGKEISSSDDLVDKKISKIFYQEEYLKSSPLLHKPIGKHTLLLISVNSDFLQCMHVLAAESGTHTGESSNAFSARPPADIITKINIIT